MLLFPTTSLLQVKYASKAESRSSAVTDFFKSVVNRADSTTDDARRLLSTTMMRIGGNRDVGSQETSHLVLSQPFVSCPMFKFVSVSLLPDLRLCFA